VGNETKEMVMTTSSIREEMGALLSLVAVVLTLLLV
jgi:hypothetical protein